MSTARAATPPPKVEQLVAQHPSGTVAAPRELAPSQLESRGLALPQCPLDPAAPLEGRSKHSDAAAAPIQAWSWHQSRPCYAECSALRFPLGAPQQWWPASAILLSPAAASMTPYSDPPVSAAVLEPCPPALLAHVLSCPAAPSPSLRSPPVQLQQRLMQLARPTVRVNKRVTSVSTAR